MLELLFRLTPILVIDLLSPVLPGLMIIAAGTQKPVINSTAVLFGFSITYFLLGIAIALGIRQVTGFLVHWYNHPTTFDFIVGMIVGSYSLFLAFRKSERKVKEQNIPEGEVTPLQCFGYGAISNILSFPFAVPYFAAVDQILRANLGTGSSLAVLAIYIIGYALPFVIVPVIVGMMGERAGPVLERISEVTINLSHSSHD